MKYFIFNMRLNVRKESVLHVTSQSTLSPWHACTKLFSPQVQTMMSPFYKQTLPVVCQMYYTFHQQQPIQ